MKTSEIISIVLETIKEIESIKYVDMYYNQDENKMNIMKFPACLVGLTGVEWEKTAQNTYKRPIQLSLLLFYTYQKSNKTKELAVIDILDDIFSRFKSQKSFDVKRATCIERTSNLSVYVIDIEYNSII